MIQQNKIFALNREEVMAIAEARHDNPHHILGMHPCMNDVYVNAYIKGVHAVHVVDLENKKEYPMHVEFVDGFYTVRIQDREPFAYQLKLMMKKWDDAGNEAEESWLIYDPYSFGYSVDMCRIMDVVMDNTDPAEGFREKNVFGARRTTLQEIPGVAFCMRMPGARRVSVVGDFNYWDGSMHPMRKIDYTDIFELFIPEELTGSRYKFEAVYDDGHVNIFADPYAEAYEKYPGNASVFADMDYHWTDQEYIAKRKKKKLAGRPVNIYEVHMPTWKLPEASEALNYKDFAKALSIYVKDMGYNYVQLLPLMEYWQEDSWGYDMVGCYAPTSRFGTPADFMNMVDEFHKQKIGVILDMVPAVDAECLMYWVDTYHLDGIRLDNQNMLDAWKRVSGDAYDDILVECNWNLSGIHALEEYMRISPVQRSDFKSYLSKEQINFTKESGVVALSHDEVALGKGSFIEKMPGGYEDKFADLRIFYGLAMTMPGDKLMFMGQEIGLFGGFQGTNVIDWSMLEFDANLYLQKYVRDLNHIYLKEPALYSSAVKRKDFELLETDKEKLACFVRRTDLAKDTCYIVCNFGLTDVKNYILPVETTGVYKEIFSSDSIQYGGEGNCNKTAKTANADGLVIQVPALSLAIIKKEKA